MDLSILIVTYNSAALIDGLLSHLSREIAACRSRHRIEVVLVDNHSADDTAARVARHHPWVRLVASTSNLGFAAGNNLAATYAQGRYLLLLNPDAVPDEGAIAQGIALMDAHPEVALGGGQLRDSQGVAQPSARMFPRLRDEFFCLSGLAHRFPQSKVLAHMDRRWSDPDAVADVDWIPGAFVFLRADSFNSLKGFDERYFMYYEEVDLCQRLRAQGWRVRFWPALKAAHIGGASARTVKNERVSRAGSQLELWRMRSALLYYRRHHGPLGVACLHGLELGWNGLRLLRSALRGATDKRRDLAQHLRQLRQAWHDTSAGRLSPRRPW